jgi:hypothetical protein
MIKPYFKKLQGLGLALLSAALLFSCNQMETFESDSLMVEEQRALLENSIDYAPYFNSRTAFSEAVDCEDEAMYCVSAASYFYKSQDKGISGGGYGGVKLEYYQNHLGEMKFVFQGYAGNNQKTELIKGYKIGTEAKVNISETSDLTLTVPLPLDWETCDFFDLDIIIYSEPGNTSLTFKTDYILLALCENGGDDGGDDEDECEAEDFYYEKVDPNDPEDYTYTFTYIPACDEMMDAVVKFTCPHIEDIKSFKVNMGNGLIKADWSSNPGKRRGAPTVISWVGDIPEDGITFEIEFKPDCTQTKSGRANVWTDFKVNEVSKKFEHSNIIAYNCGRK